METSLSTWVLSWLKNKEKSVSIHTYNDYRKICFNFLSEVDNFSVLTVNDINKELLERWLRAKSISNKRLSNIQSVIRVLLNDAVSNGVIMNNPIANWTYKNLTQEPVRPGDHVDPFSKTEMNDLLSALSGQERNMIEFMFWTGIKTRELINLRWRDVKLEASSVVISQNTESRCREVLLLTPAADALKSQYNLTFSSNMDDYVFKNPRTNNKWSGDKTIRDVWVRALSIAGVRYREPKQTRHTYAYMMVTAGEDTTWVCKQMGYNDGTTFSRLYSRYHPLKKANSGKQALRMYA